MKPENQRDLIAHCAQQAIRFNMPLSRMCQLMGLAPRAFTDWRRREMALSQLSIERLEALKSFFEHIENFDQWPRIEELKNKNKPTNTLSHLIGARS